jgi:hypothetical protein
MSTQKRNEMKRKTNDLSTDSSNNNPSNNSNNKNAASKNGSGNNTNTISNNKTDIEATFNNNLSNFYQKLQQIQQDQHVDPNELSTATRLIHNFSYIPMHQIHQQQQSPALLTPGSASNTINNSGKIENASLSMMPISQSSISSNSFSSTNTPVSLISFGNNFNRIDSTSPSFLSKSLPSTLSSISQAISQSQFNLENIPNKIKQSPTIFNFPSPVVPINSIPSYSGTLLTPNSSPQLSRDESSIPLKKRAFNNDINQIQFLSNSSPPVLSLGSSLESFLKTNRNEIEISAPALSMGTDVKENNQSLNLNLNDWLRQRVLALHNTNGLNNIHLYSNLNNKRSSSTSIEYSLNNSTKEENEYEEMNFINYYQASIQKINGTLVTVSFESNQSNDSNIFSRSFSVPVPVSSHLIDSMDIDRSLNPNQQTYDISKEGQKYSLIEDAAPLLEHLEKGLFVLYRHQNQNTIHQTLSHPSTPIPSTPTSPINTSLNACNSNVAGNCSEFKYHLGKIVDIRERKKYFLIQPVILDTKSFNCFGTIQSLDKDKQLTKLQSVTRPNIRLLSPPWFSENKQELDLKNFKDVNLNVMFPNIKNNLPFYSNVSLLPSFDNISTANVKSFDFSKQNNLSNNVTFLNNNTNLIEVKNNNINTPDGMFKNQFLTTGSSVFDIKNINQVNNLKLNQEYSKNSISSVEDIIDNKAHSGPRIEHADNAKKLKMSKILSSVDSNQGMINLLFLTFGLWVLGNSAIQILSATV